MITRTALHCGSCGARHGTATREGGRVRVIADPHMPGRLGEDRPVAMTATAELDRPEQWPMRTRCPDCDQALALDATRAAGAGRRRRIMVPVAGPAPR